MSMNGMAFSCDQKDLCDQKFMFDYFDWLYNIEFNSLQTAIRPVLYIVYAEKGECHDSEDNNLKTCPNGACVAIFTAKTNQTRHDCADSGSEDGPDLFIEKKISLGEEHNGKLKITESIVLFTYLCWSNNCNNEKTDEEIKQAIEDHHDLSSLHELLQEKFNRDYLSYLTLFETTMNVNFTAPTAHNRDYLSYSTMFETTMNVSFTAPTTHNPMNSTRNKQEPNHSISNLVIILSLFIAFF